jgi:hypothetical protein
MFVALTGILALTFGFFDGANAGQYRRVDQTATLAVGGQVFFRVSPFNHNSAMEMDVWEWLSAPAGGSYRLRIIQNNTGQDLTIRMIGLTGTQLGAVTCTTPVNGVCNTPSIALGGNFLFQAIVASGAGSPVVAGSQYTIAIQRTA